MAEDLKNVPFDAPWAANLKHRPQPNHVRSLQTPIAGKGEIERHREWIPVGTTDTSHAGREPTTAAARAHDPQAVKAEPSYYNIPILKPPVWKWMIGVYFYLGGLSAGAYIISRVAERFGKGRYQDVARAGAYLSLLSLIPCPPLLIWDLGDPKRFHHMLRVWKPRSPMNLGTWIITAYSAPVTYEAVRQFAGPGSGRDVPVLSKAVANPALSAASDLAGVPLGLMLASYTGVLLSSTANPLWSKNKFLAPLFVSSAMSTGIEAIGLALDLTSKSSEAHGILQNLDTAAHAAELACMHGFMKEAGEKSAVLKTGTQRKTHQFAKGAILAAEVIKRVPVPQEWQRSKRIATNALGLAAGLALRWAMTHGGHASAQDPRASRLATGTPAKPAQAPSRNQT